VPGAEPELAAVVLDTLGAAADGDLAAAVGTATAARLRSEVRAITRRWAAALAPGRAYEATSPAAAVAAVHGHAGPVVLVAPDVPALGEEHARSIRADLAAGAGLLVGSAHDARPYLVVTGENDTALIERAGDGWEALMAAAHERGLAVAMVRHERRLASAADARALALDPLAPPALAALLAPLRDTGEARA
jgi:hypothetical protein